MINNYYDLNYTNFAAGNIGQGVGDNALYYALSRLGTGSWNWWQNNVFGLVGFNGRLPIASFPPSIVGSNRNVNFRITRFSYGCGIQQIANSVAFVPFDCQVIIRPIEPSRRNQVHVCRFSASPSNGALQSCRPNLPIGRGFTFQTVGRIPVSKPLLTRDWHIPMSWVMLYKRSRNWNTNAFVSPEPRLAHQVEIPL